MKRKNASDSMTLIRQIVQDSLTSDPLQLPHGDAEMLPFDAMRMSILGEIDDYETTAPIYVTPQPA